MKPTGRVYIAVVLSSLASQLLLAAPIAKPLRIHPTNPRYFTVDGVHAILLTGSHTWNNLVDMGPSDPPPRFDYEAYLKWLTAHSHNFIRLWAWELVAWERNVQGPNRPILYHAAPQPWQRTGPGDAWDGKPRFDLTKFNADYFVRLRGRVQAAQDRGIYVSVMLFEGWGVQFAANAWRQHPFHPDNNINGIRGDLDGDGRAVEIHTGRIAEITALQRAYVRHVIETVNGFDNVLYEISNENHPASTTWQYDMIRFIKEQEKTLPKQHPVGMTFQYKGGSNQTLFDSPADWISPNPDGGYRTNPPAADGAKVILLDTDHLWGEGGDSRWVWQSFLRGHNPLYMDRIVELSPDPRGDIKGAEAVRSAMGCIRRFAERLDLACLTPHPELASSAFCLANPSREYLSYQPKGGEPLSVELTAGTYRYEWFDPVKGESFGKGSIQAARGAREFKIPFAGDAVLYLKAEP